MKQEINNLFLSNNKMKELNNNLEINKNQLIIDNEIKFSSFKEETEIE